MHYTLLALISGASYLYEASQGSPLAVARDT